jgi:hypothetical protein
MREHFRKRTVAVVAVVAIGVAALTGCTSATPKPTTLTTKAAGIYYLATTCKANAKANGSAQSLVVT